MTYTILTSILIPFLLFLVLFIAAVTVNRKVGGIGELNCQNAEFGVSVWYWTPLLLFFIILFTASFIAAFSKESGFNWAELIVPGLITVFLGGYLVYAGLTSKIEIRKGRVFYFNGFKTHEFSLDNIIKCELTPLFLIEVIHARNPGKPIIISPMFKDLPLLIAILTKGKGDRANGQLE